jgi:hypothetical protein
LEKKGAIQRPKTLSFKVWTKIRSAGARGVSEVLLLPKFSAINEKEKIFFRYYRISM